MTATHESVTSVTTPTSKSATPAAPKAIVTRMIPSTAAPVTFESLGLATPLLQAVSALGYTNATPVQAQVIPACLAGGDCMVSSQTGSGKTAAFLLPLLHQLIERPGASRPHSGRAEPQVLILCPTRELAQQVAADAINLVRMMRGIRIATIMGGMPYGKQIAQVKGASIVIATPGRLLDLNDTRAIRLDKVEKLVIDEADRMLDLGFADDLDAIHQRCAARDQTMMFSATFAPRIMQIASRLMNNPEKFELASAQDKHTNISQTLHWADSLAHKHQLLSHWLSDPSIEQAVIFASTQIDSEAIADTLRGDGHSASALHGGMPQAVRTRRLDSLRNGQTKILVATDVAARGIDVPTISHVINFGLPMKPEDYVHRIGRTGRAGRSGTAITIAEHGERVKIRAIERYTEQNFSAETIPGLEPKRSGDSRPSNGRRPGGGRPGAGRSGSGGRPGAPNRSASGPRSSSGSYAGSGGAGTGAGPRSEGSGRPAFGGNRSGADRSTKPGGHFAHRSRSI